MAPNLQALAQEALQYHEVQHSLEVVLGHARTAPMQGQGGEPAPGRLLGGGALDRLEALHQGELLATAADALDHLLGQLRHVLVVVGDGRRAVVARSAALLARRGVELFGKVAEQLLPAAVRLVLAVLDHPVEVVQVHLVVGVVAV